MARLWGRLFLATLGLLLPVLLLAGCAGGQNVGIVEISGPIFSQEDADEIVKELRYAQERGDIKAVVLKINSPGGGAAVIEEVYLTVLWLRETKPVVASIDQIAASGGYYIAVAANWIYAKPTSELGSIGAIAWLPAEEEVVEDIVTTGPFKSTGASRQKALSQLETLKRSFLGAVVAQRGERLKVSPGELAQAEVFIGLEGLEYGLIDAIGSGAEAIEKAASLAGITEYGLVDVAKARVEKTPTPKAGTSSGVGPTPEAGISPKATPSPEEMQSLFYYLNTQRGIPLER